jgi:hypothetical protein
MVAAGAVTASRLSNAAESAPFEKMFLLPEGGLFELSMLVFIRGSVASGSRESLLRECDAINALLTLRARFREEALATALFRLPPSAFSSC